jgi:enamine deaminase RidA (YjgF/YER057c/UK114 family)
MSKIIEQPIPQGKYLPAVRHADLIYTSGMTPRKAGKLIYSGKILAADPIESHRDAVRLATLNALVAAQACLREGERISVILQLNIFSRLHRYTALMHFPRQRNMIINHIKWFI